jgi:epoxide hydrolase-like predicted phosphatase
MIRAVFFDFGGVILRTEDPTPRLQLAARLGMTVGEIYRLVFNSQTARLAAIGKVSAADHMEAVRKALGVSPDEFPAIQAAFWEGDRVDQDLLAYVRSLRRNKKTALLSNAWDDLRKVLVTYWNIVDTFDELVISAEVGIAKPDRRIYQIALERLGVAPEEAVFVDDFIENVQGAQACGITAIQFKSYPQMRSELGIISEEL